MICTITPSVGFDAQDWISNVEKEGYKLKVDLDYHGSLSCESNHPPYLQFGLEYKCIQLETATDTPLLS